MAPHLNGPRVLIINHADVGGGAAIAGYRLHEALLQAGIASSMLVGTKGSHDETVAQLRAWRTVRRPLGAITKRLGLNELDGIGAYSVSRRQDFRSCDVVHYHAIHGSYFSYPVMPSLTKAKPAVISLHDMWPLTGHCSFSFECDRWRAGCGRCPHPEAFPSIRRDATAIEWRLKDRLWDASRMTVISPSAWLADMARESMLGRFEVEVIPHGIDTETFAPVDRSAARAALRLPPEGPVIMFAAASVTDKRKGADLVPGVLDRLPARTRRRCVVVLMGDRGPELGDTLRAAGYRVADFGYVASDNLKAALYSAADVFVLPTRADNSPLVVLESLACGTVVVAFAVGGVGELVRHDRTGLVAPAGDVEGLALCLSAVIDDAGLRSRLGDSAREMVLAEFTYKLAAERHRRLYDRVIGLRGNPH
ncbi:MAG TPA: glycosyltransferase [Acidimicrobiales bacterium]|jgi:glycosyltransferase involved in cell wall biosynthesis|nr:glycosyltransferase [Acidimicrobiales bacterium]